MGPCKSEIQKQKTRRGAGFIVETREKRATAHPTGWIVSGRRAREVMPAAMSALDRISTVAKVWFIGDLSFGWPIMHGNLSQRNRARVVA